jgi:hypothetical protein
VLGVLMRLRKTGSVLLTESKESTCVVTFQFDEVFPEDAALTHGTLALLHPPAQLCKGILLHGQP